PVAWAGNEAGYLSDANITWADAELGYGPTGTAIRTGTSTCLQDFSTDPSVAPWRERALQRGYRSNVALPLKDDNNVTFGALTIYSTEPGTFTPGEIRLLEELAGDLAFGIIVLRTRAERKRAEETLAAREMEFRNLAESSPGLMGTFYIRPDGSACMPYTSAQIEHLYGLRSEDVAQDATPLLARTHPDDVERVSASIGESARTMTPWHIEFRVLHPTRGELWLEGSTNPQPHPEGGIIWYGFIHDVTQRKRAELALKERERHAQSLLRLSRNLEQAQTYADVLNAAQTEVKEIVGYQNVWAFLFTPDMKQAKALYAKGPMVDRVMSEEDIATLTVEGDRMLEELVTATEILVVADARTDERTDKRIVAKMGNRTLVNVPILLFDRHLGSIGTGTFGDEGVHVPTASQCEYLTALASHVAITLDRIHLIEKRMESNDLLRAIIEATPAAIIGLDIEGKVQGVWNPAAEKMLGWRADEVMGKFLPTVSVEKEEEFRQFRQWICSGKSLDGIEVQRQKRDGTPIDYSIYASPLHGAEGQIVGNIAVLVDITERKKAEQERLVHVRFLESMNQINRAMQQANDIDKMMKDALGVVLSVFDCDRAWLLYPCDPDVSTFCVPMEATKPEYPGAQALNIEIPLSPGEAENMREALNTDGPVVYVAGTERPISAAKQFGVQSQMFIPVYPRIGKPWVFGIHQCSYPRIWTSEEQRFFEEISRRLSDSLTGFLMYRNLQESEQKYRSLAESSPDNIMRYDKDGRVTYVNHNIDLTVGYDLRSFIGKRVEPTDKYPRPQGYGEKLDRVIQTGQPDEMEFEIRNPQGELRSHRVRFVPERDEHGSVIGAIALGTDITDRKRMEKALAESERRYRLIAENTADTIAVFDLNMKPLYFSPAVEKLRGFTPQESLTQSLAEVLTPDSFDKANRVFAEQMALEESGSADLDRTAILELEVYRKDGSTIWVELSATFLRDEHAKPVGFLTIARDIAERRRGEQALRESEERYRTLIENQGEGVGIVDAHEQFTFINPAGARMFGLSPVEMAQRNLAEFVNEDEMLAVKQETEKRSAGQKSTYELSITRADGERRVLLVTATPQLDKDGRFVGTFGVFRDITAAKRAHESLRKLQLASEQSPASIVITDVQGNIEYVNPKFERVSGYSREEILGKNPRILKSGASSEHEYKHMWQTILGGSEWRGEFRNKRKDGELYWESASISPIKDDAGKITHFVAIKEDITERKRAEEELKQHENKRRELERQLVQAQKLESLGTLASGIAHDFNNILAIILGYSAVSESTLTDPTKAANNFASIQKAGLRGAGLVKQLLTFARKGESVFTSLSINQIIAELIALLRETLPKTITVSTDLHPKAPSIIGDATQLHQVILNLCVNARDAMPKGGNLSITTTTVNYDTVTARFPNASAREYVLARISDTGTGMDEQTKQRIFDPFFTTKGPGRGTGLGLALVYSIVESHHGMIAVDTEVGKGTAFNLYFPIEEPMIESYETQRDHPSNVAGGTETVLVIEDEEMLAEMLRTSLVANGYAVLSAYDGEQGLALFERHQQDIAVVLSDFGLPKYGGDEVFRRIRALDPKARVIIASGFVEPAIKAEMLQMGLSKFVQKPYSPAEVLYAIRSTLDVSR
ncbi:MAG: PAS domain S-box protein, partial [Ignavibacteriae bacterium]|nr:PAS domain S-box protein [Ignavibacteriota bacterium]